MKIALYASKSTAGSDRIPSAFFFIIINFNSWTSFNQTGTSPALLLSIINFNSWTSFNQTKTSSAPLPIIDFIQINISTADPPEIKRGFCQHLFLSSIQTDQIWIFFSWNNPPKITLYEDFWWFSYQKIFSSIFLHGLNFEFYFNLFYQWDE